MSQPRALRVQHRRLGAVPGLGNQRGLLAPEIKAPGKINFALAEPAIGAGKGRRNDVILAEQVALLLPV